MPRPRGFREYCCHLASAFGVRQTLPDRRSCATRRAAATVACLSLASFWVVGLAAARGRTQGAIADCPMLPADNIWNARVDELPVDPQSNAYVQTIGAGTIVHPDFGSGLWLGGRIGIPYTVVDSTQAGVDVSFQWPGESDPGPYPIPTDAPIEGVPGSGDRHILIVDRDACILYEVYRAVWQPDGSIDAGSGAIFDLRSNALRPDGWTSADAAGLPILPGLVRYEEVAGGTIDHAIRFTVPETRRAYVWPGRHFASSLLEARFPPMGQRFRLKAEVSLDAFSPEARTIAQALKTYGMILADNGSAWFLSGVPDERWDNDNLRDLRTLTGSDFEAVDQSSLLVDPNSGQVRGADVPSETPPPPSETPTPPASESPPATDTPGTPASETPPPSDTPGTPASETPPPSGTLATPPFDTPSPTRTLPPGPTPTTFDLASHLFLPALRTR
jgi:hypothetical protein